MRPPPFRLLLLILALVLGQWLALAHAFEHPALAADDGCQICAQHGLDGAALAPQPAALRVPGVAATPGLSSPQHPAFRFTAIHRIRGPPQSA